MVRYILQRAATGIPVLLGVLFVTFVLFHCAAGDPAALMAGKNARPRELERLRRSMGLDRPLFFGHWCRTELFRQQQFTRGSGDWAGTDGVEWLGVERQAIRIPADARVDLEPEWEPAEEDTFRLLVRFRGTLTVGDVLLHSSNWEQRAVPLTPPVGPLVIVAGAEGAQVREISAERYQANPFNSQLLKAVREIVDLRRDPQSGRLGLVFFDFGNTLLTNEPIRSALARGVGPSLALMIPIFVVELVLAITIAMVSAYWRDSWLDRSLTVVCVAGMSISYLVYILVGQYYVAYYLNLFPVWGFESWRNLVLPVAVGVVSGLGGSVRFYRSVFLNEMHQEYVRTARAKGCGGGRILFSHVLPNALIPILTRVAVVLPFLFTGSLLLESFFGIPGLGYAGVNALANADLQLLKALVIVGSILFVTANIGADIAYAVVDPRVRLH